MTPRLAIPTGLASSAELRRGIRKLELRSGSRRRARRRTRGVLDAVFLWIPKTAGTSLWKLLEARGGGLAVTRRWCSRSSPAGGSCRSVTSAISTWCAGLVSADFDRRAYKFCVVRDPFDRTVSLYHYLQKQGLLTAEMRSRSSPSCSAIADSSRSASTTQRASASATRR